MGRGSRSSRRAARHVLLLLALVPTSARAGIELDPLRTAADAITAMELPRARELLAKMDAKSPPVALQLGRLAMYEGDCEEAAKRLAPPPVQQLEETGPLLVIARDCLRSMASTVSVTDDVHQVFVRFQDDEDRALASLIGETVAKQRDVLAKDLGVEMPKPTRVDVVRDQFTLSALTGLPWEAARKTGTVAIAKFGRVIMLSPRAPTLGYGWRDTLAHELTHLALSRGTFDRAPLWLQEGVAKREETRWRPKEAADDALSPDTIAAVGIEKKLALPLDGLGPSIALLPSAREAMVAYAEVTSFVQFVSGDRAGEPNAPTDTEALPKIVKAYAKGLDTDGALKEVTGKDLKAWDSVWRPWVASKKGKLPRALGLDDPKDDPVAKAAAKAEREERKRLRLGQLLLAREHVKEARTRLEKLAPTASAGDPLAATWVARVRLLDGDLVGAKALLDPKSLIGEVGGWWTVRGDVLKASGAPADEVVDAYAHAAAHDPLSVEAACGWAEPPSGAAPYEAWLDAAVRGLCTAARARHLPKWGQD